VHRDFLIDEFCYYFLCSFGNTVVLAIDHDVVHNCDDPFIARMWTGNMPMRLIPHIRKGWIYGSVTT
jgi:hypothetical protein